MPGAWLIVGAGFTGSVLAERLASQCGAEVLVIDQRDHIGGNAHDGRDERGFLCHRYGPHILHTNSRRVADYLSQFTEWIPYTHRVVGHFDGVLAPIPFNLTSLEVLFPAAEARRLTALLVETYGMETSVPILTMLQSDDREIRKLADFVYENVFLGYTRKHWGMNPEELSPSVTARVPVRISYDDRYFQDWFQYMPGAGYTAMFERILAHPRISVSLNTRYDEVKGDRGFDRLVYTGGIDAFFDFALGPLPYRSVRFDPQTYLERVRQPCAQINYPNSEDFTRTTEMGHLTQEWGETTTVVTEYPRAHEPGLTEPYYPIPSKSTQSLYNRYLDLARDTAPHVQFAGRLGDYRYYNMDQAIARALSLFRRCAELT
jgi:UDP-galactopyranose mutase